MPRGLTSTGPPQPPDSSHITLYGSQDGVDILLSHQESQATDGSAPCFPSEAGSRAVSAVRRAAEAVRPGRPGGRCLVPPADAGTEADGPARTPRVGGVAAGPSVTHAVSLPVQSPAATSAKHQHAAGSDDQQATEGAVRDSVARPGGSQGAGRLLLGVGWPTGAPISPPAHGCRSCRGRRQPALAAVGVGAGVGLSAPAVPDAGFS